MNLKLNKASSFLSMLLLGFILVSCGAQNKTAISEKKYRVVIELILEDEVLVDSLANQLQDFSMEQFAWKNHLVLLGNAEDTSGIAQTIARSNISTQTKIYNRPLYAFDKSCHCADSSIQQPWKNYVLTANLVSDTVLQQEYVAYHNTQFEEWPEVAQGFCNADFQQLLVYRNGRQLMLIISIPSTKTLDELNPKTVENNPRMDEWNNRMGKYQEGIQGTGTEEVWVFLDKINEASVGNMNANK